MKAISYIYAVLNDYISCDDFVNWTFEAIEEGQIDAFDSDMIVKIQNCNCENKGDIDNLKKMLAMRFESKLRNATLNCLTECTDLPLKLMLIYSSAANKLCVDFNDINSDFDDTAEAQWLAENCANYGFIVRFPEGKEPITGYKYESWHVRYVGVETAKEIMSRGICLEEYLGVDSEYKNSWPEDPCNPESGVSEQ